jgi:CheY-like chemotaxis protein
MPVSDVGILILDADKSSRVALQHLLGSEGWRVHFVAEPRHLLQALAAGAWSLAIVNATMAPPEGDLFPILRDLAHAEGVTVAATDASASPAPKTSPAPEVVRKRRLRVLFVVPAEFAGEVVPHLEREELPYSIRPYHLHDFFEKITDLLIEAGAIAHAKQHSRFESASRERSGNAAKNPGSSSMFASRTDYQMSEEEIAEYEREEEQQRRKKAKKEDESSW